LRNYHWPGNVRELENVMQRLMVMTDAETIGIAELPAPMRFSASRGTGLRRTLGEVEAEHIRNVLDSVGGNRTQAAEILGIDRKTLREKVKKTDLFVVRISPVVQYTPVAPLPGPTARERQVLLVLPHSAS
jgi:DNA-binding NtrC family response regulator